MPCRWLASKSTCVQHQKAAGLRVEQPVYSLCDVSPSFERELWQSRKLEWRKSQPPVPESVSQRPSKYAQAVVLLNDPYVNSSGTLDLNLSPVVVRCGIGMELQIDSAMQHLDISRCVGTQ